MGLMSGDAYFQAAEHLPKISADAPPHGRAVGLDEYLRLLEECDRDLTRTRVVQTGYMGNTLFQGHIMFHRHD